ncbi:MAG: hypothetical protein EA361_18340 [Bacteroidetes bacterium]|nr:MAG: hypothetical protein EA361_18340 [Bacteroidota bacterium]
MIVPLFLRLCENEQLVFGIVAGGDGEGNRRVSENAEFAGRYLKRRQEKGAGRPERCMQSFAFFAFPLRSLRFQRL